MAALEKRFDRQIMAVSPEPPFRAPPANIEAEQALLGAILVNNDAFDRVSDFLKPDHFAEEIHRHSPEGVGGISASPREEIQILILRNRASSRWTVRGYFTAGLPKSIA